MFSQIRPMTLPLLVIGFIALSSSSCGNQTGAANGGGAGTGDALAGLVGKWNGNMSATGDDASGSSLKETTANVEFNMSDDKQGTFNIELPLLDKVYSKGIYTDFRDSLLLQVIESNNSYIGLPGTSPTFKYEMLGPGLRIYNDRIQIKLARSTGAAPAGDGKTPTPDTGETDALVADWTCKDPKNNNTLNLEIQSNVKFYLRISHQGKKTVYQRGTVEPIEDKTLGDATLTTTESDGIDKNVYVVSINSDSVLMLKITDGVGAGLELPCTKN